MEFEEQDDDYEEAYGDLEDNAIIDGDEGYPLETQMDVIKWQDDPASKTIHKLFNKDMILGNISTDEMNRIEGYALMCKMAEQNNWKNTYDFFSFKIYTLLNASCSIDGFARKIRQTSFHNIRKDYTKQEQSQNKRKSLFGVFNKKAKSVF